MVRENFYEHGRLVHFELERTHVQVTTNLVYSRPAYYDRLIEVSIHTLTKREVGIRRITAYTHNTRMDIYF